MFGRTGHDTRGHGAYGLKKRSAVAMAWVVHRELPREFAMSLVLTFPDVLAPATIVDAILASVKLAGGKGEGIENSRVGIGQVILQLRPCFQRTSQHQPTGWTATRFTSHAFWSHLTTRFGFLSIVLVAQKMAGPAQYGWPEAERAR